MGEDRKGEVGKTGVEKGRSGSGDGGSKSGPTSCVYPATYKDKQGRYGGGGADVAVGVLGALCCLPHGLWAFLSCLFLASS